MSKTTNALLARLTMKNLIFGLALLISGSFSGPLFGQYLIQKVLAPNSFIDISQAPNKLVFLPGSTQAVVNPLIASMPFGCDVLAGVIPFNVSTYGAVFVDNVSTVLPAMNQPTFNGNLVSTIVPLWDEWVIDTNDALSGVYFKQNADTLIFQWNRMRIAPFVNDLNTVTFQLQIFTSNGKMLMVYTDVDATGFVHDQGASASAALMGVASTSVSYSFNEANIQDGSGLWFIPIQVNGFDPGSGACQPDLSYRMQLYATVDADTSGQGTVVLQEIWPTLLLNDQEFALSHDGLIPDSIYFLGDGEDQYLFMHFVNSSSACDFIPLIDIPTDDCGNVCVPICQDTVNVSMDAACQAEILPGTVLELNSGCPGAHYQLSLDDGVNVYENENYLLLPLAIVDGIYPLVITDLLSGNNCTTILRIEDKLPPFIVPEVTIISCADILLSDLSRVVTDACNGDVQTQATAQMAVDIADCNSPYSYLLPVQQIVVDTYGNRDTVIDTLYVTRFDTALVIIPINYSNGNGNALSCNPANQPWDLNGNGYPDLNEIEGPIYEGMPLMIGMPYCNIVVDFHEDTFNMACLTKYVRSWQVLDDECGLDISYTQTIEVLKDLGPQMVCPANQIKTTNAGNCQAMVFLAYPVITPGCSPTARVEVDYGTGIIFSLPLVGQTVLMPVGIHTVTYTVYDQCDNFVNNVCTFTVQVRDNTNPIAACVKNVVVSLNNLGLASALASSFNLGSYDECGGITFDAKRMLPNLACGIDSTWNDTVYFCCNDVLNSPILVLFRVTDSGGNQNICMVNVTVQDKLAPGITCPPNVTVNCGVIYDSLDVGAVFGNVETDPNQVDAIYLPQFVGFDLQGDPIYTSQLVGYDGLAFDNNCSINLVVKDTTIFNITNCGVGNILHIFSTQDGNGTAVCTQTITVVDYDPFEEADITWPGDTSLYSACMGISLEPGDLPAGYNVPVLNGDPCDLTGIGHEDFIFTNTTNGACGKIIRRWRVLDWCQYQANNPNSPGIWMHDQVIFIFDTIAPVMDTLADLVICSYDSTCFSQLLNLSANGIDNCTPASDLVWSYQIDLFSDGVFDLYGNGKQLSTTFPLGNHRIRFEARDRCGNTGRVWQNLEINNCKSPAVFLIHGLAANLVPMDTTGDGIPDAAMVTVFAEDFDAGSSASCGGDLVFSFDIGGLISSITFDCQDLDPNTDSTYIVLPVYVTDQYGNQGSLITYVYLQDNTGFCATGTKSMIAGKIGTDQDQMIEGIQLKISGANLAPTETGSNGGYQFMSLDQGVAYEVIPSNANDPTNGVNTTDILLIQKHILGLLPLQKPTSWVAADANMDGKLSAADLVELRKIILLKNDNFKDNYSWRFVRKDFNFVNPTHPVITGFPSTYQIPSLGSPMMHADFLGVKMGDINGNAKTSQFNALESRMEPNPFIWTMDDIEVKEAATMQIPIKADQQGMLYGFQLTLELNSDLWKNLEIASGLITLDEGNLNMDHIEDGYILISWSSAEGVRLTEGATLFSINGERKSGGWLSDGFTITDRIMQSAVNSEANLEQGLHLRLNRGQLQLDTRDQISLYQNIPNPFNRQTIVGFYLPSAQQVHLRLTDISGKVIVDKQQTFERGYQEWQIDSKSLLGAGLYFYQLEAGNFLATKKMILVN
ncbi:MAG: T9SS type A sorting domain-containing protein [Saprospiraceae bacterium]